jgi:hypothetical protein
MVIRRRYATTQSREPSVLCVKPNLPSFALGLLDRV